MSLKQDEGIIKYDQEHIPQDLNLDSIYWQEVEAVREILFQSKNIGAYQPGNLGYGNISLRIRNQTLNQATFLITGSQTGHKANLNQNDYTLVTSFNLKNCKLTCKGPAKASSESLTHAAIYQANPSINAVIHIHNSLFWSSKDKRLLQYEIPKSIEYGTPEMANYFIEKSPPTETLIPMRGHQDGLIIFGNELKTLTQKIIEIHTSLKV